MRKWSGLFVAIVIGLCLAFAVASTGSAVPIDSAKLPQSLQSLMDSPVLQVKKSCKEDYKLVCMKTCDKCKNTCRIRPAASTTRTSANATR